MPTKVQKFEFKLPINPYVLLESVKNCQQTPKCCLKVINKVNLYQTWVKMPNIFQKFEDDNKTSRFWSKTAEPPRCCLNWLIWVNPTQLEEFRWSSTSELISTQFNNFRCWQNLHSLLSAFTILPPWKSPPAKRYNIITMQSRQK